MSPFVRKRLAEALAAGGAHFVEVMAADVAQACQALPADAITRRLADAVVKVLPSRPGRRRDEPPSDRVWVRPEELAHLLREAAPPAEGGP